MIDNKSISSTNQLSQQYSLLLQKILNEEEGVNADNIEIGIILLCPSTSEKTLQELNSVQLQSKKHRKSQLTWGTNQGLIRIFQKILMLETIGKIPSLNKDFIFLLKNLLEFADKKFISRTEEEEIEGKFKKNFIYDFQEYLQSLNINNDQKINLQKLHTFLLTAFTPQFRISKKDKRITYAIK